jgi:elongation factor G
VDGIPPDIRDVATLAHEELVEQLAETDDELTIKYLEGKEITRDELHRALRRATLAGEVTPILCGSSLRNKGVQPLLDAIVDYLPAPTDVPPMTGVNPYTKKEEERRADDKEPMAALVFKIQTDPYVGRLAYFRVYSGCLSVGTAVTNATKRRKERIGRLLRMHADHREEIKEVRAGDIAATLGLKATFTGETLCAPSGPIILESITFPEPVISVAIEPRTTADQDKMSKALDRLAEEDPTFQVRVDENTGQLLISGMGELHLEVLVDRMLREFQVGANVGKPRVAYRETITQLVRGEGRFIRQTGGRGQYGCVVLELEPLEPGQGFEFVNATRGDVIPQEFVPAVERGVREAMESGILAGYPLVDLKATLVDGDFHEEDSSDLAFKVAGSIALRDGVKEAGPVLLEPVMRVEIVAPEEFTGEIVGDLNARRAQIESLEPRPVALQSVTANVPMAEMFGYATNLRSLTQGRGTFTMEFVHYAQVDRQVADRILYGWR